MRASPARRGRAERQPEHRPDVVLELARLGALDRPVARVVHPRGELVREHARIGLEELEAEHADVVQGLRDREPVRLAGGLQRRSPRRGAGAVVVERMPSTCTFSTSG